MALPAAVRAADPDLRWWTLSTEHFRIHYHQGGEAFAQRVARTAEEAYDTLHAALGWEPADRVVHIVVTDDVDGANGLARTQAYDLITLFAFGPEADTDLGRYRDWLRILIYHELTHILHLDQVGPIPAAVNTVIGKTIQPNHALPGWFIEGIATWVESRFTGSGRVGSAQFDQYLRAAALGGTLPEEIGGFTGTPLFEPGGSWRYIFGASFLTWIVARHGQQDLVRFVDLYGRWLVPYGVNNVARQAFGEDFPTMYRLWRRDLLLAAHAEAAAARKQGLQIGRRLTHVGEVHSVPRFGPDGRLFYFASDGTEATHTYLATLDDNGLHPERLYQCWGGCGRAVWSPRGDGLYVIGGRWADPWRFYRDLLYYDLRERPELPTQVTRGRRAREPDMRPDGRKVAFVTARWGRTAVMEVDLRTGELSTLIDFDLDLQLAQPRYLPGGQGDQWRLVVSAQPEGGYRDLYLRETDGTLRPLTHDRHREIAPTLSPDGRTVFFTSDRSGIWNIHALDLDTGAQWQVSRVLGAAMNPTVSPDGTTLVYSGYHAGGFDLYALPLDRVRWTPLPHEVDRLPPAYDPPPVDGVISDYSPLRSAWPRRWIPVFTTDPINGISSIGVSLSGSDALGHHFWSVSTSYDTVDEDASVSAAYSYAGVRPLMSVFFARFPSTGVRFVADEVTFHHRENLFASADVTLSFPHVVHFFSVTAGLNWLWSFDPAAPERFEHDPGSNIPFTDPDRHSVGLRLSWAYDRTERYKYSISPEKGLRLGMSFNLNPVFLGNETDSWSLSWRVDGYAPMPWAVAHVLAFKYRAAVSGGPSRGAFSVGGFPQQNIVLDVINQTGIFGTFMRGYPPAAFTGTHYHLLSTEYRFPLLDLFMAPGTLPVWLQRLSGAFYADTLAIWDQEIRADSFKMAVGGELNLTTELFYNLPVTFRFGYAQGVLEPLSHSVYLILGSNL